jgi:hypothetical protein
LLVETGFLEPAEPRPGRRGSTEKTYRSTGKSWFMEAPTDADDSELLASHDAVRQELLAAGPNLERASIRLGLRLSNGRASELADRLNRVAFEYAGAEPDADGEDYSLYVVFHPLARRP